MEIVFTVILFFLIVIIFELAYTLFLKPVARTAQSAADRFSARESLARPIDITGKRKFSEINFINNTLAAFPLTHRLDKLLQQGGLKILASVFILSSLLIAVSTYLATLFLTQSYIFPILFTVIAGMSPLLYLFYRRKKRWAQFEALFPDALDLMGYSLKAGSSILASFNIVAQELAAPVGEEFGRLVEEINFGMDTDSALRNLANRIDSLELRFFVTSVIIQRETGGNLVEVFEKISEIIRKKFRFREKVKTLSAEVKLSAKILLSLPFITGIALFIISPSYIKILTTDPYGPYLILTSISLMSIGSLIIYRMVQLDA
ncbi:type II secretion system F family protein [Desulfogranum mediterraneum]|uniref:type II secretion system F family protein n=1 Tax=Desulfogranum mediterraneum TaxID=160661 RepID=UPI000424A9E8|nr:type II secretion system F family protein [Desulfogranum mediterraneum]